MGFLWQCSMQEAMDWQRWISTANLKGEASWKKSYAECMVGPPRYYSFWVFKPQTLNTDVCSQQLQHLQENLKKDPSLVNRWNIVLPEDNSKPHSARITQEKIFDLGWSVQLRQPYSPDLASSDFDLFPSQQNALNDKKVQENQVETFQENLSSQTS